MGLAKRLDRMAPLHSAWAAICAALALLVAANRVSAQWPPTAPPFFDDCYGKTEKACKNQCTWSVNRFPWCFNSQFLELRPTETIDVTDNIGSALKFFNFAYGVHLAEGTMKQDYYNVLVDDCAKLCFEAALSPSKIRCLSFDFYPFESPWYSEPWLESHQAGICSLNTGTAATARLRNEDQGYTDAELYYESHFTHRPVSDLSGYYELRDSRGESIGEFLEYNGGDGEGLPTSNLWGKSRWGMYHLTFPTVPANGGSGTGGGTGSRFTGGFTPVDSSQRCPGLLTKEETALLCLSAGGRLCTAQERDSLKGRKLGCSLDAYDVWAAEDKATGRKFARCCAEYEMSVECAAYTQAPRISFCTSQKVLWDCTFKGSGTAQQIENGFGRLLDTYRERCAKGEFGSSCQGALMRPWYFRETCLWCPKLGQGENDGDCRPGSDFGVCPHAPEPQKRLFGVNLWNVCGKQAACNLKRTFPDIKLPASCD